MSSLPDHLAHWTGRVVRKLVSFSGRTSRGDVFVWHFTLGLAGAAAGLAMGDLRWDQRWTADTIVDLALCLPAFAVLVRRFHDLNLSGWWALLLLPLPPYSIYKSYRANFAVVNQEWLYQPDPLAWVFWLLLPSAVLLLIIWVWPGTRGPNRYGPDPKDNGQPSNARVADSTSA